MAQVDWLTYRDVRSPGVRFPDMDDSPDTPELTDRKATTAPATYPITIACFDDRDRAVAFGYLVAAYVRRLGEDMNLGGLDGITVARNYGEVLRNLDRGIAQVRKLTPSSEFAYGVAMTPSVLRNGDIKSHMVFHAACLLPLEDEAHEDWASAVHNLAHECAHVEITGVFNRAFPKTLLMPFEGDDWDMLRWEIIEACWGEYAATWISARYGRDPTGDYETTFLLVLSEIETKANRATIDYRWHGDHRRIMHEVYISYGTLLKYASYQLGNLAGRGQSLADLPKTAAALEGHWFAPYWHRLGEELGKIADSYGKWTNKGLFENIGDLADELISDRGLTVTRLADGSIHVDVPFSANTSPYLGSSVIGA